MLAHCGGRTSLCMTCRVWFCASSSISGPSTMCAPIQVTATGDLGWKKIMQCRSCPQFTGTLHINWKHNAIRGQWLSPPLRFQALSCSTKLAQFQDLRRVPNSPMPKARKEIRKPAWTFSPLALTQKAAEQLLTWGVPLVMLLSYKMYWCCTNITVSGDNCSSNIWFPSRSLEATPHRPGGTMRWSMWSPPCSVPKYDSCVGFVAGCLYRSAGYVYNDDESTVLSCNISGKQAYLHIHMLGGTKQNI